jgi:hypothetical protein
MTHVLPRQSYGDFCATLLTKPVPAWFPWEALRDVPALARALEDLVYPDRVRVTDFVARRGTSPESYRDAEPVSVPVAIAAPPPKPEIDPFEWP